MIQVDISNIWGEISLPELLGAERAVFDAHYALTEEGSSRPGWMMLPEDGEMNRILNAAERIREESDVLIVVGTGSGCSGPRGVLELLQGPNRNLERRRGDPRIFFAGDSLSTRSWNELMGLIEGNDVSLCVLAQTGDTLERAVAFRSLRWMLERKYGTDEARQRIYAMADSRQEDLRQVAQEEGWETFAIPENTAAGFAVLSAGGLLPLAVAGIDIRALVRGAAMAREEMDLRSFENPAWLYAGARHVLHRKGKTMEQLTFFDPGFSRMGKWWQSLFGGAGDEGLFPVCGMFSGEAYAPGGNLLETMLRFEVPEQKQAIVEDVKDLGGLNNLAGKTLCQVEEMEYFRRMEAQVDGGVPVITIDCGELNEESLGQLLWFFQLACAISAGMQG